MDINKQIDYLFSKINWKESKLDSNAAVIKNNLKSNIETEQMLIMAEQQLSGWYDGSTGTTLKELVRAMGLTNREWMLLKAKGRTPKHLCEMVDELLT